MVEHFPLQVERGDVGRGEKEVEKETAKSKTVSSLALMAN